MKAEGEDGGEGESSGKMLTLSTATIPRVTEDIAGPHPPRKSAPFVRKRRKFGEINGIVKSPLELIQT